jgi:hypothetical protein
MLAAGIIDAKAMSHGITLPTTTELVLELDDYENPPVCRYYFIDHSHKTEFWLEVSGTDILGVPPVTSYSQLSWLSFESSHRREFDASAYRISVQATLLDSY